MDISKYNQNQLKNIKLALSLTYNNIYDIDDPKVLDSFANSYNQVSKTTIELIEKNIITNIDEILNYMPLLNIAWEHRKYGTYNNSGQWWDDWEEMTKDTTYDFIIYALAKHHDECYIKIVLKILCLSKNYFISKDINKLMDYPLFWNDLDSLYQLLDLTKHYHMDYLKYESTPTYVNGLFGRQKINKSKVLAFNQYQESENMLKDYIAHLNKKYITTNKQLTNDDKKEKDSCICKQKNNI